MNITIPPARPVGTVRVISSKSYAHRILLCAALSNRETFVRMNGLSQDVAATVNCLKTMGCKIENKADGVLVAPPLESPSGHIIINCGESGTLARFILPIAAHLYENYTVTGEGSLLTRPFAPLCETLAKSGCVFNGDLLPISGGGKLKAGTFAIAGDVSSQFISGLLLAAPLLDGDSEIVLTSKLESSAYVDMTVQAQKMFGVEIEKTPQGFKVKGNQKYVPPVKPTGIPSNDGSCAGPSANTTEISEVTVEGDWSNAAFFLCMNALGADISVQGLSNGSLQGDKAVTDILREFAAKTNVEIDAAQIPDLIPVLSVTAAARNGSARIYNAARLRIKESDRLQTTFNLLTSLGADAALTEDGLLIKGKGKLLGGTVDGANDHRIVMAAATASCACGEPVVIQGYEAVNKSYPNFFEEFFKLSATHPR